MGQITASNTARQTSDVKQETEKSKHSKFYISQKTEHSQNSGTKFNTHHRTTTILQSKYICGEIKSLQHKKQIISRNFWRDFTPRNMVKLYRWRRGNHSSYYVITQLFATADRDSLIIPKKVVASLPVIQVTRKNFTHIITVGITVSFIQFNLQQLLPIITQYLSNILEYGNTHLSYRFLKRATKAM